MMFYRPGTDATADRRLLDNFSDSAANLGFPGSMRRQVRGGFEMAMVSCAEQDKAHVIAVQVRLLVVAVVQY